MSPGMRLSFGCRGPANAVGGAGSAGFTRLFTPGPRSGSRRYGYLKHGYRGRGPVFGVLLTFFATGNSGPDRAA